MQRISQRLTQRIKELAERYEFTLSELSGEVETLEKKSDWTFGENGLPYFN